MIRDWMNQIKEMDTINLIILVLTFLSVTLICWGLVVIYCCLASYCDSPSSLSSNASLKKFSQFYSNHYPSSASTHHHQSHLNIFQVPTIPPPLPSLSPPGSNGYMQHPHMAPSSFHPHHSGHPSWNISMFGHPPSNHDQIINDRGSKVMVPISDIVYI